MRSVGVIVNLDKPEACEVKAELEHRLTQEGIHTLCLGIRKDGGGDPSRYADMAEAELVFVLGGDGTLLGVARQLATHNVPLLGINVGHLGFLSEAEPTNIEETVRRIANREYDLEQRLMIEAEVIREGHAVARVMGLNDVGVAKGSFARMVSLDVFVGTEFVDTYSGDGVIVSTPTGSTAYSLSCGGPIVVPHLNVILITPICPHTLISRPCVIDGAQEVRLIVHATHEDVGMTVDGQVGVRLTPGDEVRIRRSQVHTTLVRWRDREFFSVLRQKLHGQDASAPKRMKDKEGDPVAP